jgi:hypothetical protein
LRRERFADNAANVVSLEDFLRDCWHKLGHGGKQENFTAEAQRRGEKYA